SKDCTDKKMEPKMKETMNHSTTPQSFSLLLVRLGRRLIAACVPHWAVNELITKMTVLMVAKTGSSSAVLSSHRVGEVERSVKYIANRRPKIMTSDDSQPIVPAALRLGRLGKPVGLCQRL